MKKVAHDFIHPDPSQFVAEGRWCVEALLENALFEIDLVVKTPGSAEDEIEKRCRERKVEIQLLDKKKIAEVAGYEFHRGVLALARRPRFPVFEAVLWPDGLLVCCPELADPSNLGAIARTAAALGASGLIVAEDRGADLFSRKSIRASSGAIFRLPVFALPALQIGSVIEDLRDQGYHVFGSVLEEKATPLQEVTPRADGVLLLGPEKEGLSPDWTDQCDTLVRIPMVSGVDSLNVAASAAILIYHLVPHSPLA